MLIGSLEDFRPKNSSSVECVGRLLLLFNPEIFVESMEHMSRVFIIIEEGLVHELKDGERVEADDGYRGHAPEHMGCPACISKPKDQENTTKGS